MKFLLLNIFLLFSFFSLEAEVNSYEKWSKDWVSKMRCLPIQEGGRIKPISSYARYTLLRFSGKSSVKFFAEKKKWNISETEWLFDCFFRPKIAVEQKIFQVEDISVLQTLGFQIQGKKRNHYSYTFLLQEREKLKNLTEYYRSLEKEELSRLQKQILSLGENVFLFESLLRSFDFAKKSFVVSDGKDQVEVHLSEFLRSTPILQKWAEDLEQKKKPDSAILWFLNQGGSILQDSHRTLSFFPPLEEERGKWENFGERGLKILQGKYALSSEIINPYIKLENAMKALQKGERAIFEKKLLDWREEMLAQVKAQKISSLFQWENFYYKANFLFWTLILFLMSVFCLFLHFFFPVEFLKKGIIFFNGGGLLLLWISIFYRSLLMQRPPVGNLYDTIPFITGIFLLFSFFFRKRSAVIFESAGIFGILGLLLAFRYEFSQGIDVFDPLVAVLNSNFWLTIHVLTITSGYGAGLFASALGKIYLIREFFFSNKSQKALSQTLYSAVFLTLTLSLLGTLLGGIWANESWGRFWGWDPKENGALMIVLWNLVILHARLCGWIEKNGTALLTSLGGAVIVFSWWHVNFLGVGLHSYGFSEGKQIIWYYYFLEVAFCFFFSALIYFQHRKKAE